MSISARVNTLEKKHHVEKIMISCDHALRIAQHYLMEARDISPEVALKIVQDAYKPETKRIDVESLFEKRVGE